MLANLKNPEGAAFSTPGKRSEKPLSVLDELETYWQEQEAIRTSFSAAKSDH